MADDRGSIKIPVVLENQTSAEFVRIQAEGNRLTETFAKVEAAGEKAFNGIHTSAVNALLGPSTRFKVEAGAALEGVQKSGEKAFQGIKTSGSSAFRELLVGAGFLRRSFSTLTNILIFPFAAGTIFNLFEQLVRPLTLAVEEANNLDVAFKRATVSAASLGKTAQDAGGQNLKAFAEFSKQVGADPVAAVDALSKAINLGLGPEMFGPIIQQARVLNEIFGTELPKGIEVTGKAWKGNAEALKELQTITGQFVANSKDIPRLFEVLDLSKTVAREEAIIARLRVAGDTTSDLFKALVRSVEESKARLEKISIRLPTIEEDAAFEAVKKLSDDFAKLRVTAADAIPVRSIEERLQRISAAAGREIDAILRAAQAAAANLPQNESGGFAQGVVRAEAERTIESIRARADSQRETVLREAKERRIKDVIELQKLEDDAQLRRLQKQEEWAENVANQANRIGDVLAGVWEQYDQGLISSSQLTKSIIRGLIQEFRGDLTKQLTKAFVTAIFSGAANSGGGGGSGTTTFIETGARGLTAGPSGIMGGTKISDATFWHSYRNNPVIGMDAGGIVSKPTTFVAGEGGKEAVIPLDSGGKVPVRISGGAGGSINISVTNNVHAIDQTGMDGALSRSNKQLVSQVVAAIRSNNFGARDAVRGA